MDRTMLSPEMLQAHTELEADIQRALGEILRLDTPKNPNPYRELWTGSRLHETVACIHWNCFLLVGDRRSFKLSVLEPPLAAVQPLTASYNEDGDPQPLRANVLQSTAELLDVTDTWGPWWEYLLKLWPEIQAEVNRRWAAMEAAQAAEALVERQQEDERLQRARYAVQYAQGFHVLLEMRNARSDAQ